MKEERTMSEIDEYFGLENDLERDEEDEQTSEVWLAIGDLMSGLLLFFALLFIVTQVQLQQKIAELARYKAVVEKLPLAILAAIEQEVGGNAIAVDPETGDVNLDDRILFAEGQAELKPEGKAFLRDFIPTYSEVIFSDAVFEEQVVRVVIEGHTSSQGSDIANRELSLQRALAVTNFIFSEEFDFPNKRRFESKILISGRGEIDANQTIDDPRDRKVTFRFQLRRPNFSQLEELQE